jgi:hypothetical protein
VFEREGGGYRHTGVRFERIAEQDRARIARFLEQGA